MSTNSEKGHVLGILDKGVIGTVLSIELNGALQHSRIPADEKAHSRGSVEDERDKHEDFGRPSRPGLVLIASLRLWSAAFLFPSAWSNLRQHTPLRTRASPKGNMTKCTNAAPLRRQACQPRLLQAGFLTSIHCFPQCSLCSFPSLAPG